MPKLTNRGNLQESGKAPGFAKTAALLSELSRSFYARGWALGTSGNFSAVVSRKPLRLAITPNQADKGALRPDQILLIDAKGKVVRGSGRHSSDASLHLAIVGARGAGAVSHTHSVWSTLLSEAFAREGGLAIEGYEMLKGLEGVPMQEPREWLPVLENLQQWRDQAPKLAEMLRGNPAWHGFLIQRHGLYTWGRDLAAAKRHCEILEFLLEVVGRRHFAAIGRSPAAGA